MPDLIEINQSHKCLHQPVNYSGDERLGTNGRLLITSSGEIISGISVVLDLHVMPKDEEVCSLINYTSQDPVHGRYYCLRILQNHQPSDKG